MPMDVELRIRRFNPEADREPHWETYTVPAEPTDRVLDLLHHVKRYVDVPRRPALFLIHFLSVRHAMPSTISAPLS